MKERSKEYRKSKTNSYSSVKVSRPQTKFLGYKETSAEVKITDLISDQNEFAVGDRVSLCFEATPFYAESGGQVGDTGEVVIKDASSLY